MRDEKAAFKHAKELANQCLRLFAGEDTNTHGFALGILVADYVARHRVRDSAERQMDFQRKAIETHLELVVRILPSANRNVEAQVDETPTRQ